jgi:Cu/Ag efflux pump CusA
VFALSRLRIEAFPDVTNVEVIVITLYPGPLPKKSGER